MYSGILGVFPNLLINQHGASGDGKSVALWYDTQVPGVLDYQWI